MDNKSIKESSRANELGKLPINTRSDLNERQSRDQSQLNNLQQLSHYG